MRDVDVAAVPEQIVLAIRGRAPLTDIGRRMRRLRELVAQAGLTPAGPMMARFYEEGPPDRDLDHDVCLPVVPRPDGGVPDQVGEARSEWLPRHHALETVHRGPHDQMKDAARGAARGAGGARLHAQRAAHRGLRDWRLGRRAAVGVRDPHTHPLRPVTRRPGRRTSRHQVLNIVSRNTSPWSPARTACLSSAGM